MLSTKLLLFFLFLTDPLSSTFLKELLLASLSDESTFDIFCAYRLNNLLNLYDSKSLTRTFSKVVLTEEGISWYWFL
jgi:hypothetical protein